MRRRPLTILTGITLALVVSGCTAEPPSIVEPTITPFPLPTVVAAQIGCDEIVPPEDAQKYAASGWVEATEYVDQLVQRDDPLTAFVDGGGSLCAWGLPASDFVTVMAAGPIDEQTASDQRARLDAEGYTRGDHNGAELYRLEDDGHEHDYLFVRGYWFYGSDLATVDHVRLRADVG